MKNLFDPATVDEVQGRLAELRPDSERQWGKMTAPQMLAHCSVALEWAVGEREFPPVPLALRAIGRLVKPFALKDDTPMKRNSPTAKELIVTQKCDFTAEQERLRALIGRFLTGGPEACTARPHVFFGPLTPEQWGLLMYKHLDHHLRQFGA